MSGARTEEATPKRLRRAREEGDVGASAFASQSIGLVAAIALLPATVTAVAARAEDRVREAIGSAAAADPDVLARFDVKASALDLVALLLPLLAAVAIAGALGGIVQGGGVIGTRRLAPRLERLNPVRGLGRLVSRARLFAVGRALVGAAFVAWVVAHVLRGRAVDVARTAGRLPFVKPAAMAMAETIAWEAALVGLAIAAVDVAVVRLDWRRRLRMTRDEVKRELKETAGDPLAKEARERGRAEVAARGVLADVRVATIVVRDGTRAACALRYEEGDTAPKVIASGAGSMAEQISRVAREQGLPVVESAEVARALAETAAGEPIPEALYDDVAMILRDLTP